MDELRKHYSNWQKPVHNGSYLYDAIYMECSEEEILQRPTIVDYWLPRAEGKWDGREDDWE